MRRLALLSLFLGIVLAGAVAALAAGDPHAEKERLNAADTALAKRIAVRSSDLPAGWTPTAVSKGDSGFTCRGFDPDFSKFTITGKTESAFQQGGGLGQIDSGVEVYPSRAQAVDDFTLGARPELARCLRDLLEREFAKSSGSFRARVASSKMVGAPRLGERAVAYRLVAKIESPVGSVPVYLDVLAFQRKRSIASLMFVGALKPVQGQTAIAGRVASRMH